MTSLACTKDNEYVNQQLDGSEAFLKRLQPHFMFNALSCIRYLCSEDPHSAEIAVEQFSAFLRGSLRAFKLTEPISFEEELDCFKSYWELVKLRFKERVQIDYYLEATDFKIPAMVLSPLVANALKHGILKRPEGGKITIITLQLEGMAVIKILDDGAGFAPGVNPNATSPEGNLAVIGKRLQEMCGATLTVSNHPGKGASIIIKIPESNYRNKDNRAM